MVNGDILQQAQSICSELSSLEERLRGTAVHGRLLKTIGSYDEFLEELKGAQPSSGNTDVNAEVKFYEALWGQLKSKFDIGKNMHYLEKYYIGGERQPNRGEPSGQQILSFLKEQGVTYKYDDSIMCAILSKPEFSTEMVIPTSRLIFLKFANDYRLEHEREKQFGRGPQQITAILRPAIASKERKKVTDYDYTKDSPLPIEKEGAPVTLFLNPVYR